MKGYLTTYSGKRFYPANPNMDDCKIEDIAHALSLITRGNGHIAKFFSVGQHCIFCALEARERGYSNRIVLACLLHDASECYLSDLPSPIKKEMVEYQQIENDLLAKIQTKFLGTPLTNQEAACVELIDKDLLKYDLYYLLNTGFKDMLPPLKISIDYTFHGFENIEETYLKLFYELSESIK